LASEALIATVPRSRANTVRSQEKTMNHRPRRWLAQRDRKDPVPSGGLELYRALREAEHGARAPGLRAERRAGARDRRANSPEGVAVMTAAPTLSPTDLVWSSTASSRRSTAPGWPPSLARAKRRRCRRPAAPGVWCRPAASWSCGPRCPCRSSPATRTTRRGGLSHRLDRAAVAPRSGLPPGWRSGLAGLARDAPGLALRRPPGRNWAYGHWLGRRSALG